MKYAVVLTLFWSAGFLQPARAVAADWPMWRYDATRSAASPEGLPADLKLSWVRQYSQREQVWDDPLNNDLMPYDRIFEPIVVGRRLIFGFNDRDKVVALDLDSGAEAWTFYCDGPVRFAPAAWKDKLYVASDDGYLYCLKADSGTLDWKFRGAPNARKALGNKRVISCWPARGGPVVRDGKVYFAASIWPFMGTFIYALDAATGQVQWVNDSTSALYTIHPHGSPSFASVAPQGALVATEKLLLVPGGRSTPGAFDRVSGDLRSFLFVQKGVGGSFVCADEKHMYVHTRERGVAICDLSSGRPRRAGKKIAELSGEPVLLDGGMIHADSKNVAAAAGKFQFKVDVDGSGDAIVAGDRIYAAGKTQITALDTTGKSVWSHPIDGQVLQLVAGGGKLVAVTLDGRITVFGDKAGSDKSLVENLTAPGPPADAAAKAKDLLARAGQTEGYAFWYGIDDPALLEAVLAQSQLRVIAVESDPKHVEMLRRRFDAAGLYGKRVTVHAGDPVSFAAPPYIANLVIIGRTFSEQAGNPKVLAALYETVRPFGGALVLADQPSRPDVALLVSAAKLVQARVASSPEGTVIFRDGPLPGAADWTHQYGDVANTVKSNDQRVKLPLGVLWWGGNSNLDILPRHGHGPPEQVVGGRTFIEGMDCLSARDTYTGRVLWKRQLPELDNFGVYFDGTYKDTPLSTAYNQVHIPGANARGTNFVATIDEIYVAMGSRCEVLDAATGKTKRAISMPTADAESKPPLWGFIGIYDDVLLGGAGFANYSGDKRDLASRAGLGLTDLSASDGLVAFNRHTGELLWRAKANCSFLHNAIVAGGGRVYCLDRLPGSVENTLKRRGLADPSKYRIVAFDAQTGKPIWQIQKDVFGTWLSYSAKHDLLLQAGAANGDRLKDEVDRGMIVYRGRDGSVAWEDLARRYNGPCIIHNDTILTNISSYKTAAGAFSIVDGKPSLVKNPLTGEGESWQITRNHGCNSIIASENLLTFRSGAAGFYDLKEQSGTGNFGGFKSSCTSNLVVAGGVLNAPDYTRTCSCSYQNQTSLALVHMPDAEVWTSNTYEMKGRVRQLGINFGAPGDRRSQNGTMWLEYPASNSPSPKVAVDVKGAQIKYFCHHAATISGDLPWVAASGVIGAESITIQLNYGAAPTDKVPTYTVRLFFAEPEQLKAGDRVFDVSVEGRPMLKDFDVVAESGGPSRSIVRELKGVAVRDTLTVVLTPKSGSKASPLTCAVEIIAED